MKYFLCHRRGLPDVTIGFFGGIGGCDGAAPSALAAAGSGLWISCSRFRRFSLRLGCSWFRLRCFSLRLPPLAALGSLLLASAWLPGLRLPRLAALSSPLLAPAWLLVALTSPLVVSTSLLLASAWLLGLRLPPLAALSSPLAAAAAHTAKADGARRSHSHKFHFKTLIPTC